jgi:hypothetical protein
MWEPNENNPYEHFDLKNLGTQFKHTHMNILISKMWEPNENCAPFEKILKIWDHNENNPMKETFFKM